MIIIMTINIIVMIMMIMLILIPAGGPPQGLRGGHRRGVRPGRQRLGPSSKPITNKNNKSTSLHLKHKSTVRHTFIIDKQYTH